MGISANLNFPTQHLRRFGHRKAAAELDAIAKEIESALKNAQQLLLRQAHSQSLCPVTSGAIGLLRYAPLAGPLFGHGRFVSKA